MKNSVQLYALTTSGDIKTLIFETSGSKFITHHGRLDGKMQTTFKVCEAKNVGRGNALTAAEQAVAEMNAKITKKMKEGYSKTKPKAGGIVKNADVDLRNLPESFCPSKPISKCPSKVENGKDTYGQRKFNGNCLILTKTKVFSRRMKDLTDTLGNVPEIKAVQKAMREGDMFNTEITFFDKKTGKESNTIVGSLVRTKDPEEVMEKHALYSKSGTFRINVFDLLFLDNKFLGDKFDYLNRHALLVGRKSFYVPELYMDWKKMIPIAKKEGWEGFVLRVKGDSAVTYTLNGKADRAGCYKYKFMKEGDFVVTEVALGEAGRHAKVYAKFKIGQYQDGKLLDCGWAGPGILTHEELEQYTREIDSKKLKLPFVVEIEFRDWQEDSTKLEHPVIQRIRFDKSPDECVFEG